MLFQSKYKKILSPTILFTLSFPFYVHADFYLGVGGGVQLEDENGTPIVLNAGGGYHINENFSVGIQAGGSFLAEDEIEAGVQDNSMDSYTLIHLDARTNGEFYGFGSVGYATVESSNIEVEDTAWSIGLGGKMSEYEMLEVGYTDLPDIGENTNDFIGIHYKLAASGFGEDNSLGEVGDSLIGFAKNPTNPQSSSNSSDNISYSGLPLKPEKDDPNERLLKDWSPINTAIYNGQPSIKVCIRDHECEDGDKLTVRVGAKVPFFQEELFNNQMCKIVPVPSGKITTYIRAENGTGYKGACSHANANTGEISVHGINSDGSTRSSQTQSWHLRAKAGSRSSVQISVH